MRLSKFILHLTELGELTLSGELTSFDQEDIRQSIELLQHLYQTDALEMPHQVPDFQPEAALWSTQYIYRAMQLLMRRELGEEVIEKELKIFSGEKTAANIYSIDLTLRYLPNLFHLAKGLAPGDYLVDKLRQTAQAFPFSSIGIELNDDLPLDPILAHPSLRLAYIDRIIAAKAIKRLDNQQLRDLVTAQLGDYAAEFWPAFKPTTFTS